MEAEIKVPLPGGAGASKIPANSYYSQSSMDVNSEVLLGWSHMRGRREHGLGSQQ